MICLTGDLHHASLCTGNQKHADRSEIRIAADFTGLLEAADVRATFFVSGKSFLEERADLESIVESRRIEIGGPNWSCFQPQLLHRIWNKVGGSYNGPEWFQRRDARKTSDFIYECTGRRIRAWRNHQYMHSPHTERALASVGIELCSDGVARHGRGPVHHPAGILNFPLNVIPDHEHIYHAERTPEWVEAWVKRYDWSDDFGSDSYDIDTWVDMVLEQLQRREAAGVISNLIIHPITMYLADGFDGFRRILDYLATRRTVFMSEVIDDAKRGELREAA